MNLYAKISDLSLFGQKNYDPKYIHMRTLPKRLVKKNSTVHDKNNLKVDWAKNGASVQFAKFVKTAQIKHFSTN